MRSNLFTARNQEVNLLDPAEVESNRRGQITTAQQARLNGMVWGPSGCVSIIVPLIILPFFCFFLPIMGTDWSALVFGLVLLLIVAAAFGGILVSVIRNWMRLQRDKGAGMLIRQTVGELEFDRQRRYGVRAGERTLALPTSKNIGGLLPGLRYIFFYLEESGFVLSAEQLGTMSEPAVEAALQTVLMQVNHFTAEDLQANKNGEITSAQRTRALTGASSTLFFILIPFLIAGVMLLSVFKDGFNSDGLVPLAFIGIMALVFMGIGLASLTRSVLDVINGAPEMLKGTGRKHSETRSSGKSSTTYYYYIIGEVRFQVDQAAYNAFIDSLEYVVYYLPRTKKLLSIEPIDVPDNY